MIISDKQKEFIKNGNHRYNLKVRCEEMWKDIPRYTLCYTKANNRKKRQRWIKCNIWCK